MSFFALLIGIVGLAFLDSLNPFSIAAMAVVIVGGHSIERGLVFIGGTFIAYFLGGLLILYGFVEAIKLLLPLIPTVIGVIGWGVLGIACLGGAVYLWLKKPDQVKATPTKAKADALFGVLLFALASTAADIPTAIPYFGAIPMILEVEGGIVGRIIWIGIYTLVYVSPLILLLCLRVFASRHFEPFTGKIQHGMDFLIRRLCPPLMALIGLWAVSQVLIN